MARGGRAAAARRREETSPFKRLSKDQQTAQVEARAFAVRAQLERLNADYVHLEGLAPDEDPEVTEDRRKELDRRKAELEDHVGKLDSRANSIRGKPLAARERAERDRAIKTAAANELEQLVIGWEQTRLQHELNAVTGVDPQGQPVDAESERSMAASIALRVEHTVPEIDRLRDEAGPAPPEPEPPAE